MNAKSFAEYCSTQGLKCVLRDIATDTENSADANVVNMMFADQSKKNPDVKVAIEFVPDGDVTVWINGFAKYDGYPDKQEVLRRLNSINAVTPFANFVLREDELIQVLTLVRGTVREPDLLELIFFNIHTSLTVTKFIFAKRSNTDQEINDFLNEYEVKGEKM